MSGTYPCKFGDGQCDKFNPEKYACLHGGGVGCGSWRKLTDESICQDEGLRRKVMPQAAQRKATPWEI